MLKSLSALLVALGCGIFAAGADVIVVTAKPEYRILPAGSPQTSMVRFTLTAPHIAPARRAPAINLAIALDRSGSMHGEGKLANAKAAAKAALAMLSDDDTFALVTYDNSAGVLVPATRVTPAARNEINQAIDAIQPGGMTALFSGVALAASELAKTPARPGLVSRLLLLSDGLANVGPASPGELGRYGAGLVKEGVSVSTIGVGSDYNEDLMISLAQNSDGNFYFVENSRDLALIFEKELNSALAVAAQRVRIRIQCPPGIRPRGILGHQCRIDGQVLEIDFNQIYAGHDKVLILQFDLPAGQDGLTQNLADFEVEYLTGEAKSAPPVTGRIAVAFAADASRVQSGLDKEVSGSVALQQAALLREEAIRAADAGDFDAGTRQMRQAQKLLESNAALTQDAAVAEAAERQKTAVSKFEPASPEVYNRQRKEIRGSNYQEQNSQIFKQR